MPTTHLTWNRASTPEELHSMLEALSHEYPIAETGNGRNLRFTASQEPGLLRVNHHETDVTVEYASVSAAIRGVGFALAGTDAKELTTFKTLGIMLDCSRNAVMKVSYLKGWMRRLALLGYNMVMLYTEDTYQLPEEPFFGYMRGGYSAAEVREIDAYGASLGIKVIACIQTLGHLGQILKWNHYKPIRDTPGVLMVDEEKTYELIEKMIKFWAETLGSDRIHIGMDEAHDMGRGRFMDKSGFEPAFDIFNRHLSRVSDICVGHGLKPMIWSDMYFRMGNPNRDYYDRNTVIPKEVREKIPASVDLVYWDYYQTDEEFYREWIRRHRDLGHEPIMASGLWTWSRFWYDHDKTSASVVPCVNACRKEKLQELIFTMWGDGGSYCEFDSAFAGLAYAASLSYGGSGNSEEVTPLLEAICECDYASLLLGSGLQVSLDTDIPPVSAITILWDDSLLGIGWQGFLFAGKDFWPRIIEKLKSTRHALDPLRGSAGSPDFGYLWNLTNVLIKKIEFREALVKAYDSRDRDGLLCLKDKEIPGILAALADLESAFRRQWMRRNKPFGMEVTQIRLGAQSTRYREAAIRIGEFLENKISTIDELEARPENLEENVVLFFDWLATGSLVI